MTRKNSNGRHISLDSELQFKVFAVVRFMSELAPALSLSGNIPVEAFPPPFTTPTPIQPHSQLYINQLHFSLVYLLFSFFFTNYKGFFFYLITRRQSPSCPPGPRSTLVRRQLVIVGQFIRPTAGCRMAVRHSLSCCLTYVRTYVLRSPVLSTYCITLQYITCTLVL